MESLVSGSGLVDQSTTVNHKNVIERQLDFKTYMITLKILSAVKVLRKLIIAYIFTKYN